MFFIHIKLGSQFNRSTYPGLLGLAPSNQIGVFTKILELILIFVVPEGKLKIPSGAACSPLTGWRRRRAGGH
jgi:hypothetical protein